MFKLVLFIIVVVLLICGCILLTRHEDSDVTEEQVNLGEVVDEVETPQSSVGGGAHREATSETMEAENDLPARDPKTGRFVSRKK